VGLLSNKNKLRYGSGFGVGVYNVRFWNATKIIWWEAHTLWSLVQLASPSEKRVGWMGGWALSSWPPLPGLRHKFCWGSSRRCAYWPHRGCLVCSFTGNCNSRKTIENHKTLRTNQWSFLLLEWLKSVEHLPQHKKWHENNERY
jgi:hypothetical protein